MSLAVIDDLAVATSQLRTAMQATDLSAIEKSLSEFRAAVAAVKAVGDWRGNAQAKERAETLLAELESSRMLAFLLGDMVGQMQIALAEKAGDQPQPVYRPAR